MQSKGQPIACVIDCFNHRIDLVAGKGRKMQDGAKNLLFQRFDATDLNQSWGDIVAL